MIAEALEAAWLVASALAAWIVAGVAVVTVGVLAAVAGGWWAVNAVRDALRARLPAEDPEKAVRSLQPRGRRSTPRSAVPSGERKRSEAA